MSQIAGDGLRFNRVHLRANDGAPFGIDGTGSCIRTMTS